MPVTHLLRIERAQFGTRGGQSDMYLPAKYAPEIMRRVAEEFECTVEEMLSPTDRINSPLTYAAHTVAVYALRQLTALSLHAIAALVKQNYHSSVIYALKIVNDKKQRSQEYADELASLVKKIHDGIQAGTKE